MTPEQFRTSLRRLGLSQTGAALFLGRGARTVYGWISGEAEIPDPDAMLIAVMVNTKTTADDARKFAGLPPLENLNRHRGRPRAQATKT